MWIPFGYLIAAVLFILGLKKLSHPRTAPLGNRLSSLGMAVAIGTALVGKWNLARDRSPIGT